MRFRRLRHRLAAGFGSLLLALVAGTVALVAFQTAGALREQVREGLDRAPAIFDESLAPLVREARTAGAIFEQDGLLTECRRAELDLRSRREDPEVAQQYAEYLATLRAETFDRFMNPELADCPNLFLAANQDLKLVVDIRVSGPEVAVTGLEDPRPGPTGDLPPSPALDKVMRTLQAHPSFLLHPDPAGRPTLYLVALVPLQRQFGEQFGFDGVVAMGWALGTPRAAQVARLTGCTTAFLLPGSGVLASARPDGQAPPPGVLADLARVAPAAGSSQRAEGAQRSAGSAGRAPLGFAPEGRELGGRSHLVQFHPLTDGARPVAWAAFLRDLDAVEARVRRQVLLLALLGLASLAVVLALSWRIAAHITRPVEALAGRMRRVGEGDLSQQAEVEGEDEVAQLGASFNQMTAGLRQKEALKTMVPEAARRDIERDPSGQIVLGGRRVEATIMFSDLRGFTSMSEAASPTAVVELLNEYLHDMTLVIQRHRGDINEYIGDAILAVFHDREGRSGASLAVAAALEMQEALEALRARTANETLRGMKMGVGIHTGDLVEGYIGAAIRTKWGVVGDTVNLAARIQDRSRDGQHTCILVSGATRDHLGDEFELAFFGDETFKGKSGTTPVWEVVGTRR